MTKELQDLVWSILPKEFKEEVKNQFQIAIDSKAYNVKYTLGYLFGDHNLTSNAEGEPKFKVGDIVYNNYNRPNHTSEIKEMFSNSWGYTYLLKDSPGRIHERFLMSPTEKKKQNISHKIALLHNMLLLLEKESAEIRNQLISFKEE